VVSAVEMEEMDLREYWQIIVKRKRLILAVFRFSS